MKKLWNRVAALSVWIKILAAGVAVAFIAVAGFALYQNSQFPANDSNASLHIWVNDKPSTVTSFGWTDNLINSGSDQSLSTPVDCPAESTEAFVFLSYPGQERKGLLYWPAYGQSAFMPGTTKVLEANLKPSGMVSGQPGPRYIHSIGGNFSIGLACTTNNGGKVLWVSYRHASIQAAGGIQIFYH
ncbi:MAG: hypothetical protein ACKOWK_07030 [Micrococcales bacterium]